MARIHRVCVIGGGPSGASFLYHLEQARSQGKENLPEAVCYEKQSDWGGQWNYTWRTGEEMCDLPCVVLHNHIKGLRMNHVITHLHKFFTFIKPP